MIARLRMQLMKRRALSAYQTGEYELAQSLFQRIMNAEPGSPGARHNLALTHIAKGDYPKAEQLLLSELEDFGEFYPRLRVLADLYYVSDRREDAHLFYRRALDCDAPAGDQSFLRKRIDLTAEDEPFARVRRAHESFLAGNQLMQNKQWDEAISEFTRSADYDETNIHAMNNAGSIYLNHKNDPRQAAGFFKRALKMQNMPWIARNLLQAEKSIETGAKGEK